MQAVRPGRSFLSDEDVLAWRPAIPESGAALSWNLLRATAEMQPSQRELVEAISIPEFADDNLHALVDRVQELVSLRADWDSYGADRVKPEAALHAIKVYSLLVTEDLPRPHLVPTVNGGVQLEWHLQGVDFEIEVLGRGRLDIFFEDDASGETIEESLLSVREYDRLEVLAKEFARRAIPAS